MDTGDFSSISASLFGLVFFSALVTLLVGRQLQWQLLSGQHLELPAFPGGDMLLAGVFLPLLLLLPLLMFLLALLPAGVFGRVVACDWPMGLLGRAVGFLLLNGLSLTLLGLYELSLLAGPPAGALSLRLDLLLVGVLLWPSLSRMYGLRQLAGQQADQPGA